jgi:hypothetical protein
VDGCREQQQRTVQQPNAHEEVRCVCSSSGMRQVLAYIQCRMQCSGITVHAWCCCVPAGGISSNSSRRHQQVILQFPAALPLPPLQPVLRLEFSYPLVEGLDGFYRSSFIGKQSQVHLLHSMLQCCALVRVMMHIFSLHVLGEGLLIECIASAHAAVVVQLPACGGAGRLVQEQLHR